MENEAIVENQIEDTPQVESESVTSQQEVSQEINQQPQIQSTLDISDEEFDRWYESQTVEYYNDNTPSQDNVTEEAITESDNQFVEQEAPLLESGEELYEIKANGIVQQYTLDELKKLAPKAIDYTKKMQEIAPYRKINNAMKEHGITADDINQLIDIKNGNEAAKRDFLSKYKLNEIEQHYDEYGEPIKDNSQYSPNQYGRETTQVDDVISDIKVHPAFPSLSTIVGRLDKASKLEISKNPNILRGLLTDIDSRIYFNIDAEVRKQNDLNPDDNRSYLEKYIHYAPIVVNRLNNSQQKMISQQQNSEVTQRRKAAGLTGNKNVTTPIGNRPLPRSVNEISDADLDAYLQSLGLPI